MATIRYLQEKKAKAIAFFFIAEYNITDNILKKPRKLIKTPQFSEMC